MPLGPLNRRAFLLGTAAALGGGGAALALMRSASALSIEKISAQSPLGVAFSNRCQPDAEHERIRKLLEEQLSRESGAPGTTLTAQEFCPLCGCPIIVSRTF